MVIKKKNNFGAGWENMDELELMATEIYQYND